MKRRRGWIVVLVAGVLLAPADAFAEDPQRIAAPSDRKVNACQRAWCADYVFNGSVATDQLRIDPINGRTFDEGEIAFFNIAPPAWPYPNVQGYEAVVDFTGSNHGGSWWRLIACRANGPDCEGRVWTPEGGGGLVQVVDLLNATSVLKVGLQFRGKTGSPDARDIRLRARVRWRQVDTVAPTLAPTAGDAPFGAVPWLTALTGADVDLGAEDNTDLAGEAFTIGKQRINAGFGELPDGRNRVDAFACDIAGNCSTAGFDAKVDTNPPVAKVTDATFGSAQPAIPAEALDPPKDGFASGLAGGALTVIGDDESTFDVEPQAVEGGYRFVPKAPVPEGTYEAALKVRDVAGNSIETLVDELIVDLRPPRATVVSPPARSRLDRAPKTITANLYDSVRVDRAVMKVDGVTRDTGFSPGSGSITYVPKRMCPGRHSVRVTAVDPVGRADVASWSFSIRGRLSRRCARERRCTVARARVERARERVAKAKSRSAKRSARRSLTRQLRLRKRAC